MPKWNYCHIDRIEWPYVRPNGTNVILVCKYCRYLYQNSNYL